MNSAQYDELIKKSIGNKHLLEGFCYYDDLYFSELRKNIAQITDERKFAQNEYKNLGYGRIKICSVASSSRIGFLYGMQNDIKEFEKTDIINGICHPHYDNYDKNTNTFYEYKCHEFLSKDNRHNSLLSNPDGYTLLIKKCFPRIEMVDTNDLYGTFNIEPYLNFDFKQLLCHVLGLLGNVHFGEKAKLQYIMFKPADIIIENNPEASRFLKENENKIESIFENMKKQIVCVDGEEKNLGDYIELNFSYQDVSKVRDFIYERIENI